MWTQSRTRVPEVRTRLLDLVQRSSVGSPLPGERVLAADWGVARMTLRRAVDDLVADGLLERRHGSGTYVARPKTARRLALVSFSEDMHRHGVETSTRVLELRQLKAPAGLARNLRLPIGDEILRLTRLRLADGAPACLEVVYVAAALVPGLSEDDLQGSWYELLRERYGVEVFTGSLTVEPVLPDAKAAELLQIATTQPCFLSKVTVRDRRGQVIEISSSLARGDQYRLSTDL